MLAMAALVMGCDDGACECDVFAGADAVTDAMAATEPVVLSFPDGDWIDVDEFEDTTILILASEAVSGAPVAGVTVELAVEASSGGDGYLDTPTAVTGADGFATVEFHPEGIGCTGVTYEIVASSARAAEDATLRIDVTRDYGPNVTIWVLYEGDLTLDHIDVAVLASPMDQDDYCKGFDASAPSEPTDVATIGAEEGRADLTLSCYHGLGLYQPHVAYAIGFDSDDAPFVAACLDFILEIPDDECCGYDATLTLVPIPTR